jgi:hypothetical protein
VAAPLSKPKSCSAGEKNNANFMQVAKSQSAKGEEDEDKTAHTHPSPESEPSKF